MQSKTKNAAVHVYSVDWVFVFFFAGSFPEPQSKDVEHVSSTLLPYIIKFAREGPSSTPGQEDKKEITNNIYRYEKKNFTQNNAPAMRPDSRKWNDVGR